jgi:excisionase family DNA binding protein
MKERLLCTKREAAGVLGLSVRTVESLIAIRELKSIRVGGRRMIPAVELERFVRRDHPTQPRTRNVCAQSSDVSEEQANG